MCAQPVDRTGEGELCRAQPGNEPAASRLSGLLERTQYRIDAGEPAWRALGAHALPRDDAVAFEQLERSGVRGLGRRGRRLEQRDEQRPAARARGRPEAREASGLRPPSRCAARTRRAARDAQGTERVVRDLARPHEIPQRGEHDALVGRSRGGDQVGPEARARAQQPVADRIVHLVARRVAGGWVGREQADPVAEEEPDAAVVGAERARAGPHDFARRAEFVEHRRPVAVDARGQHVAFEHRHRDREALQLFERLEECVGAAPAAGDALPRGQEPREGRGVDRLDLVPQRGERSPAQCAQHVGVAPLPLDPARTKLAEHDTPVGLESGECVAGAVGGNPETGAHVVEQRTARACARSGRRDRRAAGRPDR